MTTILTIVEKFTIVEEVCGGPDYASEHPLNGAIHDTLNGSIHDTHLPRIPPQPPFNFEAMKWRWTNFQMQVA